MEHASGFMSESRSRVTRGDRSQQNTCDLQTIQERGWSDGHMWSHVYPNVSRAHTRKLARRIVSQLMALQVWGSPEDQQARLVRSSNSCRNSSRRLGMQKLKGKAPQRVAVEHVNVNAGGQAIVGAVLTNAA